MARTQFATTVAQLQTFLNDTSRGPISLVGGHGGLALITGPVIDSLMVPGTCSIETEHGVIYLEPSEEITIQEDLANTLTSSQLQLINGSTTTLLQDRFGWTAETFADEEALNNLVLRLGGDIDTLLHTS